MDALITGFAAGLVAAPLAAAKSGLSLTGAFKQALSGAFGEATRRTTLSSALSLAAGGFGAAPGGIALVRRANAKC